MNFKLLAAAAAVALTSFSAQAATFGIQNGDSYDILSDNTFSGIVQAGGGAGSFYVEFYTDQDPLDGTVDLTINTTNLSGFSDLTVNWYSMGTNLASAPVVANADMRLSTLFTAPYLTQNVEFIWTDSQAGAGFDFSVSAVPLPAGVLLLGTALGGLGLARRRKS